MGMLHVIELRLM